MLRVMDNHFSRAVVWVSTNCKSFWSRNAFSAFGHNCSPKCLPQSRIRLPRQIYICFSSVGLDLSQRTTVMIFVIFVNQGLAPCLALKNVHRKHFSPVQLCIEQTPLIYSVTAPICIMNQKGCSTDYSIHIPIGPRCKVVKLEVHWLYIQVLISAIMRRFWDFQHGSPYYFCTLFVVWSGFLLGELGQTPLYF